MARIVFSIIMLVVCSGVGAQSRYDGGTVQRGTVVSLGRVDSTAEQGSGSAFDVNYSSVAVNIGAATKKFGDWPVGPDASNVETSSERISNVYAGVGFSRLVQLQYGTGNHGELYRVRTDLNINELVGLLTFSRTPKDRLLPSDRITFSFSAERYSESDEEIYDNFTWGLGLLF